MRQGTVRVCEPAPYAERERVDGYAQLVRGVEHVTNACGLVGLDQCVGRFDCLCLRGGLTVELAHLGVDSVRQDDDGLAALALLREVFERVA